MARKRFSYSPSIRLGALTLEWDDHLASARRSSTAWAATDRGWLFATLRGREPSVCLGHYLDYQCTPEGSGGPVHAVSCVSRRSERFADPIAARAWLESEARGHELNTVLRELVSRGTLYQHEADSYGAESAVQS